MRPSLSRRLATPIIAAGAAITLMLGGAGAAVAYNPATTPPASTGDQSTDNLRWNLSLTAVNGASGSNIAHPGDTVTYSAKIWKNSGVDRYITAIRQIQPVGFEYISSTVSRVSTIANEGGAGVKSTCTGGGCDSVPILGNKGYKNAVNFDVTYKIPTTQATGDYNASFRFDVYTFGSQSGGSGAWVRIVTPTTTTLTAPANTTAGTVVDLTATVDPANAGGTVQFKDGSTDIGAPVLVDGNTATLSHTFATLGTHNVTAVYTSGTGFDNSKSAVSAVEVGAPAVDTTTTLSVPPTALTGTAVDLTATVAPTDAVGSVQFKDGGINIGDAVAVAGGTATLSHAFDTAASHSITAEFIAGAGFHNSTSAASVIDVTAPILDTTTTVTVPATTLTGTAVDLTATVAPTDAVGSVQFKDGGINIGDAVAVAGGTATLSHAFDTAA
ncbi:Ig-like domain-containing protein, partial [Rhodococcus sp. ARC_M6]|uniref:Ig-like domain-containing protein n=1 Tax=Rhodococcus sp. ARC_M6 TaxID=2928852 RepID=UPI001FB26B52